MGIFSPCSVRVTGLFSSETAGVCKRNGERTEKITEKTKDSTEKGEQEAYICECCGESSPTSQAKASRMRTSHKDNLGQGSRGTVRLGGPPLAMLHLDRAISHGVSKFFPPNFRGVIHVVS